jgi:hypothetical protein
VGAFLFLLVGGGLVIAGILQVSTNPSDSFALVVFGGVIGFFTWFPTFQAGKGSRSFRFATES